MQKTLQEELFLVFARIKHDASEDNFYKVILSSPMDNELLLISPDEAGTKLPGIEPFKTKSKIKHSPPKSPLRSLPNSQDICLLEANNRIEHGEMRARPDMVFQGGENCVFDGLSNLFDSFLEEKKSILLVNWFIRLNIEEFWGRLLKKLHENPNIEAGLNGIIGDEVEGRVKYESLEAFEREMQSYKGNKKSYSGFIYRFRLKRSHTHLIIVDLFNAIEKVNSGEDFSDSLSIAGRVFYHILTDKEEKSEFTRLLTKVMKNGSFCIASHVNLRDIEPFRWQIVQGMRLIEEFNETAKKFKNSMFLQILLKKKGEYKAKENKKNKPEPQDLKEMVEKLRMELNNKEDTIRRLVMERSAFQDDKSLLEGILEETTSIDSKEIVMKNREEKLKNKEEKVFYSSLGVNSIGNRRKITNIGSFSQEF